MNRRILYLPALIALALVTAACGSSVAANDVEVGTCTSQDFSDGVGEIESMDCSEPHLLEVFAVYDLPDGDYPGDAEISQQSGEGCAGDRFEDYVGVPFVDSIFFVTWVPPTEKTWNDADDRTVICFIVTEDGSERSGSVRGINQ